MIDLGLTSAQLERLQRLLVTNHGIRIDLQLMNLEHKHLGNISDYLLGGQVTIDALATESTRQLEVELLDPYHKLKLDADAPEDGSMYFTRMFRVIYSVIDLDTKEVFSIPIFTGPLSKAERNGHIISATAIGKEKLSNSAVWNSKTYKKGLKKTWIIRNIMSTLGGEKKLDIPDRKTKSGAALTMNREKTPWQVARQIARGMGFQLFYDGRGVARMRKVPKNVVYTFGEKGALLTLPQAGYDAENAINAVRVIGGKPKGSKKKVTYTITAPRSHALSPWSMGRWDVPRFLSETINDSSIKSIKEAKARAKSRLKSALIESVEVAFDSLPIPFLEEQDLCRVNSQEFAGTFRLQKMTIPLTADGKSSIGYLRRVTPNRRQIAIKTARKRKRNR